MILRRLLIVMLSVVAVQSHAAEEQKEHTVKLLRALKEGASIETIRIHIEGADINAKSSSGLGVCHWAVEYNRDDVLEILLNKGADVNATDWRGHTPLHYACLFNLLKPAEVLLNYGANREVKNKAGQAPVDLAREHGYKDLAEVIENYHDSLEIKEPVTD